MTRAIECGSSLGGRGLLKGPAGVALLLASAWITACGPNEPGIVDLGSAPDTIHAPDAAPEDSVTALEDSVTVVDDWTAPPPGAVVSDPVASDSNAVLASHTGFSSPARATTEELVYVSLPPGSLDGGTQVVVANRESGLLEVVTLVDGGFDPVAVRGSVGDTLDFNAFRGSTEIVEWWAVVPLSSPPAVVRSNPARGKRDVPVALSPFMVFSEPMDAATLDQATIRLLLNGVVVPGRVELTSDLLGVTFTPDEALVPNSVYVLSIESEAADLDGQDLAADHDVVFITELASGPPPSCAVPSGCGRVVFVSARDGNPEIYSVNADGTDLARLTNDATVDDQPAWSPDGQRIAFVSNRSGGFELYVMNADGSNVVNRSSAAIYNQRVPSSSSSSQHPSWSPDGTKIVYSALSDLNADLWITSADSGGPSPTLFYQGPGLSWDEQPAWSPDGTRIAFVSDWFNYSIVYDVFLINADGSGLTTLTRPADREHGNLSWSPDATRIAFTHAEWAGTERVLRVGVMGADGSGLLLLAAAWWRKTSWSPDGQMIAFTAGVPGAENVAWTMADGSGSGIIVADGWSPDWR